MDTSPDDRYWGNAGGSAYMEEIGTNHDTQPIRNVFGSSSPPPASKYGYYGSVGPQESSIITRERARNACEVATVAEIDRIMKRHIDTLLDELEDVRTRFSQFESRTHNLESSVDDLKMSVKNTADSTDGKLRHLENILREVQNDVQVLRDRQEIAEVQLQFAKLQAFKGDRQTSLPHQSADPPTRSHQIPSSVQEFLPPGQSQPPTSHQSLGPLPPSQEVPQYCPPSGPRQPQPPFPRHPEETPPYVLQSHAYSPNICPLHPTQHHRCSTPPSFQFDGTNPDVYEPSISRVGPGQFPYPPDFAGSHPHDVSSPHCDNSKLSSSGSSNLGFPRAEIPPRSEPDSSDTSTRALDKIVDQAVKMGFSRDQVKTTIRKLTESGKSVDLNAVLDRLNDNEVIQPQNIWRA